ncbi:HEAT repeat domain-containing protein [Thalassoroseus pseudoceratinae]|uniref:HEAT repeat domain-containing protein n=1 Tax=Thalassoroseus pseudoceratinae TaxID=2713176 RepID=UPI0014205905|nr:HEAT repeat domain-containing protein [Thalassoroseus pseudoceratinae]
MAKDVQVEEFRFWLTRLGGNREQEAATVAQMRLIESNRFFALLHEVLAMADAELRCQAALAVFHVEPSGGVEFLVSLLDDPEWIVRVEACGLLHDIAETAAVSALNRTMRSDPHPMVRNTAAYALGGIGDPVAIPALIEALDNDHEPDELGHTTSACAMTALDNILKTNHTRIKSSEGLCQMQPEPTDVETLKAEAMEVFRNL